jgi:hypothetical protein
MSQVQLPPDHECLSHDGDFTIYRCGRGCIHLRLNDVTLRLERSDWDRFAEVCAQAGRELQARRPGVPLVN